MKTIIEIVIEKLDCGGFGGLFYPGDCACECSDLAPCGIVETSLNGFEIGCQPGYKHLDPRPGHVEFGDFAIWSQKEEPSLEQWDNFSYD